ncbi:hypothetical protein GGI15_002344 [Coemansia interrupta]|uniref:Fungal-type protein kinase domain-containing protein n=1 Tax=Coemansia interrupta TaxID=1126814 RepID=A0A9W8HDC5_9FUNG|nr:hypothetical protein GGI15_002344 [Coemansia interrupta]
MDLLHLGSATAGPYGPLMKLARQRSDDKENDPPVFAHESEVYESIRALMSFINDTTASVVMPASRIAPEIAFDDDEDEADDNAEDGNADLPQLRRFSYYMGDLPMPEDGRPDKWMNMAVMLPDETPPSGSIAEDDSLEQPKHGHMLSIVEARCSVAEEKDAFEHMAAFSRWLLAARPDRRFVWGFVVCDSDVHACMVILGNVITSTRMDISTPRGRLQFVSIMVSMAFVDSPHLGYDPTVRYARDTNQWEIDIVDSESREKHTYRVVEQITKASLIYNNMRTFKCTRYQSPDTNISDTEYVFVKDVWSPMHIHSSTHRNEVYLTRKVSEKLKDDSQLDGTYPKLLSGGIVSSETLEGDDTTDAILRRVYTCGELHHAHYRLAVTPFASPIRQLESFDELIVVAADIMTAYMAVAQKCNILHRDISKCNVMFTRRENGSVRGLLIDFDHAIENPCEWGEDSCIVGTGHYMSIRTLEGSDIRRTTLDDWESMFYVLCWEATYGLKRERARDSEEVISMIQVNEWQADNPKAAAQFKRGHMDSLRSFSLLIARHFYWDYGYDHLKALLTEMYMCIFQNKNMSPLGRGALKVERSDPQYLQNEECQCKSDDREFYDSSDTDPEYDAIHRRSDCSEQISSELLEIIQRARVDALKRIELDDDSD